MQSDDRSCGYWKLDYDWSKRGGEWGDYTDVLLVGNSQGDSCVAESLAAWVALQGSDKAELDGEEREIFYAGGVQGYLETSLDSVSIYLHSHGQDAFDSLSYSSKEIARFLRSRKCQTPLRWTEARHDRSDHQLKWE